MSRSPEPFDDAKGLKAVTEEAGSERAPCPRGGGGGAHGPPTRGNLNI